MRSRRRFHLAIGRRLASAAACAVAVALAAPPLHGQIGPVGSGWTHFSACPSDASQVAFNTVKRHLESVVRTASAQCDTVQTLAERLKALSSSAKPPLTTVLVDRSAFIELSTTHGALMKALALRPMNVRLFARPLYVFQGPAEAAPGNDTRRVGVLRDPEIDASRVNAVAANVLNRPYGEPAIFQNVAELARCLKAGSTPIRDSRCPAIIGWAAVVERDASSVIDTFRRRFDDAPPKGPALRQVTVAAGPDVGELQSAGSNDRNRQDFLLASENTFSGFGAAEARTPGRVLPAVLRPEGSPQQAAPQPTGWIARLVRGAREWVEPTVYASQTGSQSPFREAFPLLLVSGTAATVQVRSALSDAYVRALAETYISAPAASTLSPCSPAVERMHRAYVFNAYLDDPADSSKRVSLASGLVLNRPADEALRSLLSTALKLDGNAAAWPALLGAKADEESCRPATTPEKLPEARLLFANADLTLYHRATEHLRLAAASSNPEQQRQSLAAAAACLKNTMLKTPVPSCFKVERSTYHVYYDPYFFFAAQQASGGRNVR